MFCCRNGTVFKIIYIALLVSTDLITQSSAVAMLFGQIIKFNRKQVHGGIDEINSSANVDFANIKKQRDIK